MTGRKIRVLHVLDSFDAGGAQEVVANLLSGCDPGVFAMETASMHRHGIYTGRFRELGAPAHSLSPHKLLPLYVPNLAALLVRGRFDIVHTHLTAANLIAKPLAALFRVPVLINHDHANDASRRDRRILCAADRLTNRLSTHICAVSRSTREFLIKEEHIAPEKISLVHNGIDLDRFEPGRTGQSEARARLGLPAAGFGIGGIGRLTAQKNFQLLLEAAARLKTIRTDFFVVLAGTGPLEAALRQRAAELGLSGSVHFIGHLPDTAGLYPALDLLVMPSLFEGLPMVLLEAMAMKTPVVAAAVDGVEEVLTDGEDSILVRSWDAEAFASQAAQLLDDPARRARLSAAARAKVVRGFSRATMCARMEEIYKTALDAKGAAGKHPAIP